MIENNETTISSGDITLPASIDMPAGEVRGGVVVLHSASAGNRSFFLYQHLGRVLRKHGIAVMRFDRRPRAESDVPFSIQAADAAAAIEVLHRRIGDVPIGLWGFSQGAWAASLAAAIYPEEIAWLILVSGAGVSPAAAMRYGCAEQLRRRGYGAKDLEELAEVRMTYEAYQRGELDRDNAQVVIDAYANRPWFDLIYVPRQLQNEPGNWRDMDYDPSATFASVACPVLAFYGNSDEWVPIDESVAALKLAVNEQTELSIHRLSGCDHHPTFNDQRDIASVSPDYTRTLVDWVLRQLPDSTANNN